MMSVEEYEKATKKEQWIFKAKIILGVIVVIVLSYLIESGKYEKGQKRAWSPTKDNQAKHIYECICCLYYIKNRRNRQ